MKLIKNYVRKRRLSVTDTMNQSPQVKASPSNFPLKQHNQKHFKSKNNEKSSI